MCQISRSGSQRTFIEDSGALSNIAGTQRKFLNSQGEIPVCQPRLKQEWCNMGRRETEDIRTQQHQQC